MENFLRGGSSPLGRIGDPYLRVDASLSIPGAAVSELLAHLRIAPLAELRRQCLVDQHRIERIDAQAKLSGTEMHVAHALAKDPLIDTKHRPGPLR